MHSVFRLVNPVYDDDDKFTPTKHLTPLSHHSSQPTAAHTDTETPLLHQKKGRARRRVHSRKGTSRSLGEVVSLRGEYVFTYS